MGALLHEKKEGSLEWFHELYRENAAQVYRIALHILKNPAEAEDICHDVFLEVIQNPEQYDPNRGSIKAWLAVKAKSRAIDRLRKQNRQMSQAEERATAAGCDPTSETVLKKLETERLHECLKLLPQPQREALTATYFNSMHQQEWAQATGRPLGTVKSRVRYGVNNIRKQFQQMGWLEPS